MSGGKISLSLGGTRRAATATNGVKRPRAALQDEVDDDDELGKAERVSHFDAAAGGAIDASKKREEELPLVIPGVANRDWREAANKRKRQKSGLPEARRDGNMDHKMADVEAADAAKKPGFGLNIYASQNLEGNGHEAVETNVQEDGEHVPETVQTPSRPKTDDELAIDALLGKTTKDNNLTIPTQAPMSESDAFQHDVVEAPAMATLDDYARVPVDDFGKAMLRGMGWRDGEGIGNEKGKKLPKQAAKAPERRANLLGIGAKEDAAIAQEMGVWGKTAKKGQEVKIYNPVLLKDKKTGETYTEEELQKKREHDERRKYEEEYDRKEREGERKQQKKRREDEYEYEHGHRRREKAPGEDRDDGGVRSRDRRKRSDESDEEYFRRKEKDLKRKRDREKGRVHESERSGRSRDASSGGRDNRHRERHRYDRDRDRDRERRY